MVITQEEMNKVISAAIKSETTCFIQTNQLIKSIGKAYIKNARNGTYEYKKTYEEMLGTKLNMVELNLKFDYEYLVPHFNSRGEIRVIRMSIVTSLNQLLM